MKPFQTGPENEYNNMSSSCTYRPFLGIKEWNRIGCIVHLVWYFGQTRTILRMRKQHMFLYIMHVSSTSTKNMTGLSRTEAIWANPTCKETNLAPQAISTTSVILLMEEILDQLRLVVYPIIYDVLYIPGGAGCLPSTVGSDLLRPCLVKHSGSRGRIPHGQFPTCNIPWRSVVNGRNRQKRRDINQQSGPWHNFKTCFFGKQSPYERTCYLGVSLESQTTSPNHQSVTKLKQDMWKKT